MSTVSNISIDTRQKLSLNVDEETGLKIFDAVMNAAIEDLSKITSQIGKVNLVQSTRANIFEGWREIQNSPSQKHPIKTDKYIKI